VLFLRLIIGITKFIKLSIILLVIIICIGVIPQRAFAKDLSSVPKPSGNWSDYTDVSLTGTGKLEDNYIISNAGQLAYAASKINAGDPAYVSAYYRMTADLDLSAHDWIPIGTENNEFTGFFYGDGHKISGLTIGSESDPAKIEYAGLFGCVGWLGNVINVNIVGASIYATYNNGVYIGALAAVNDSGYIRNCSATVHVSSSSNPTDNACVGGLVGFNTGTISDCYTAGTVKGGICSFAGGITGDSYGELLSVIYNCSTKCNVIGGDGSYIGGFTGNNGNGIIYNSYASGTVTGGTPVEVTASYTGGFAGCNYSGGYIVNCYATGNVTGGSYFNGPPPHKALIGGFIGKNYNKIYNCYATGNVTGGTDATLGGFSNISTIRWRN
jgi:hypothetical protein